MPILLYYTLNKGMKKPKPQQPLEAPSEPAEELATIQLAPRHTLERIRSQKPERLQHAIECLADGMNQSETARATGLSRPTIFQIAEQHEDQIGPLKTQAARQCRRVHTGATAIANQYVDRHFDPDDDYTMPLNMVSVLSGVYTEKELLLAGEATERREVVKKVDYTDLDTIWKEIGKGEPIPVIELEPKNKEEQ